MVLLTSRLKSDTGLLAALPHPVMAIEDNDMMAKVQVILTNMIHC